MLVFDKVLGLSIAFAFGLAGLPLSFWLFRDDDEIKLFDKLVVGYVLGFVLVPALFLLESFVGVLYSAPLIPINWIAIFALGCFLLVKDKALKPPSIEKFLPSTGWLPSLGVLAIMLAVLLIGLSSAGAIIFELDPYYYMEGVRQVVSIGKNLANDGTAWYPDGASSHMGQPLWKYAMASWFSLYNGPTPYSPYALAGIASIYPPIIGALSVFFVYLLFRQLYGPRSGILAAGILGFMPIMLIKFQGGDFQIEPYNVFSLFFFFAAVVYAFKHLRSKEALLFFGVSYSIVILASNLSSLITFSFAIFIFLISLSATLQPSPEHEARRALLFRMFALVFVVQLIAELYSQGGSFSPVPVIGHLAVTLLIPLGAMGLPWAFDKGLKYVKWNLSPLQKLASIFFLCLLLGGLGFFVPGIKAQMDGYISFGAYVRPLERTIAEQAPGSEFYHQQFGPVVAPLAPLENPTGDIGISAASLALSILGFLNFIPTFLVNLSYSIFTLFMNTFTSSQFANVQKGNSLMMFFLFSSALLLAASWILSYVKKQPWAISALLLLPYIVPVAIVGFGKQKLGMYLAFAGLFAAAAFWGEAEKFGELALRKFKLLSRAPALLGKRSRWNIILSAIAIILVLIQLGGPALLTPQIPGSPAGPLQTALSANYGNLALPLLMNSLTPRVQDNPSAVLPKLKDYCLAVPQDTAVCSLAANWNTTANNPVQFYSSQLCLRSLWPYPDKQPPADMGAVFGYRCSFVSDYWLDSMEWMRKNVDEDDRVISWWDYGHWTNFFAEKNTVLRNEHASPPMIERTAYVYVHGTAKELRDAMRHFGSKTALFDIEIVGSGSSKDNILLGGKFGALNYLGCSWINKTSYLNWPGQSQCEQSNIWEQVYVPVQPQMQKRCVISEANGISGIEAYVNRQAAPGQPPTAVPVYCMSDGVVAGQRRAVGYKISERDENGDLKLQRALWQVSANDGKAAILTAFYTKDKIWPDATGTLTDGWADRTAAYYNSNLYSAFFLNELEGFDLVYNTPQIRIYRMKDDYYNSDR